MGELIDGQALFPGESEIDQLYCIQKVLGQLIPQHQEAFLKNPHFLGLRFPEISKFETLEKRYVGKISRAGLSFMKACLCMDPELRMNAAQALNHQYFEGVKEGFARPKTSSGGNVVGCYHNKAPLYISNKNSALAGNSGSQAVKSESGEQRQKIVKGTGSESNEIESGNQRTGKEAERGMQEEVKRAQMFYIAEEHEIKPRIKSLKKKIKIYDINKLSLKNQKPKGLSGDNDSGTPSRNGSKKQLPYINHHYNFETSQKKIEFKGRIKDDSPDLCGGPEDSLPYRQVKFTKSKV